MYDVAQFGLTPEQIAERRTRIGGSEARTIMEGTPDEILDLWREKRGEARDDVGGFSLPMLMGQVTEPLNIAWFRLQTGREVTDNARQVRHPSYDFMGVTLDGLTTAEDGTPAVLQCKHVNEFSKAEEVKAKYTWQIIHELAVTGRRRGILSVLQGTMRWWFAEIELDPMAAISLIKREQEFWECVKSGKPPVEQVQIAAPALEVKALRTVDMSKGNAASEWADLAGKFIEEAPFIARRATTDKSIRDLVSDDVGEAFGSGLTAKRRKDGALVLTIDKPKKQKSKKETADA